MTTEELIAWRQRRSLTKKQAAAELGLPVNCYGCYELGYVIRWRDRQPVDYPIPRHIALACAALEAGLSAIGETH
jgi:hypothetical protein